MLAYKEFVILSLIVVVTAAVFRALMLWRFKSRHHAAWIALGEPSYLDKGFFLDKPSRQFEMYLLKGKWLQSGDPLLILIGILYVVGLIGCLTLFYCQEKWGYAV